MTGKVVLEEHFAIPETLDECERYVVPESWGGLQRRLRDFGGERLDVMDRNGIELAILSLNTPGIQGIRDTARAIDVARRANDVLAEAVALRPRRFGGFAALPMQDPDAASAELTRAVRELGFKGALVNGFSQKHTQDSALYYDDPAYEPFWATAERLHVPFYLHPRDPLPSRALEYDGHPWLMGAAWAFAAETALHALRLLGSGLFDRHPALTIILGHLGEGLPYNVWRLDQCLRRAPRGIPARRPMTEYLRTNVYLTTSGNFRTPTLLDALAEIGADRILFSVDYPFEDSDQASRWLDEADISDTDRLKIGRMNALRLFRLEASTSAQSVA